MRTVAVTAPIWALSRATSPKITESAHFMGRPGKYPDNCARQTDDIRPSRENGRHPMSLTNWSRNQADEIVACARRWIKRLDERGLTRTPPPPSARTHKKRHSVNRERSREDRDKAARGKRLAAANVAASHEHKAIVRAYFAGELTDLSTLPKDQ